MTTTERSVAGPPGWYHVAWSTELKPGDVRPLTVFGDEYVLYRSERGIPVMLSAFCPHLGAHLGYGGCVVGEDLRCPFHEWVWSPTGENVDIPYSDRPIKGRRLDVLDIHETGGMVLARSPVEGRVVSEVPDVAVLLDGAVDTASWAVRSWERRAVDIRLLAENLADPASVEYIYGHRGRASESAASPFNGRIEITHRWQDGAVKVVGLGLGLFVITSESGLVAPHVMAVTPVQSELVDFHVATPRQSESSVLDAFDRHVELLERMVYLPSPNMTDDEASTLLAGRTWIDNMSAGGDVVATIPER